MIIRQCAVLLLASCSAGTHAEHFECQRSDECEDAVCLAGRCVSNDTDRDAGEDATTDLRAEAAVPRGPCANAARADASSIALNEVLANVPQEGGDANGDGTRDAYEDEFVEIVNVSTDVVDLVGSRLLVGGKLKHSFEPLCLRAGESVVVFGGGSIGPSVLGNALIADRRLALPNDGGVVELIADGLAARVEYQRAPAASLTLTPQLSGSSWVSHLELSAQPFSPGSCADGEPLVDGCVRAEEADAD